jgi:hypothetical protein
MLRARLLPKGKNIMSELLENECEYFMSVIHTICDYSNHGHAVTADINRIAMQLMQSYSAVTVAFSLSIDVQENNDSLFATFDGITHLFVKARSILHTLPVPEMS